MAGSRSSEGMNSMRGSGEQSTPDADKFFQFDSENLAPPGTEIVHNQHPQSTNRRSQTLRPSVRGVRDGPLNYDRRANLGAQWIKSGETSWREDVEPWTGYLKRTFPVEKTVHKTV
ncbi:hypothetical protein PoB_001511900 [Plakobranchus ocellatus]|uniref:Uncharacterized protein n=1 Tax=Plakobranchus ocellatus TaxID=259542 RepID=A0AAV3Z3M1_9GAST|nr:hypothetical protein PoB_001511900 [Plakobranchus ocellatus]